MKIPEFTIVQNLLKRSFYQKEKAITIYTEDKITDKAFYKILLERLMDKQIKINDIIPLGPKQTVIEKSIDSQKYNSNSLFIVDSDISIMDNSNIETKNLIPLSRYCIENFLICSDGIIKLLHIRTGQNEKLIKNKLEFDKFLLKNGKLILKLYYRYYISKELNCGCRFSDFHSLKNQIGPPKKIDSTIINLEIKNVEKDLKQKLKELGYKNYKKELEKRIKEITPLNPPNLDTIIKVLSGKSQLLPLINIKLREVDNTISSVSVDRLKRELAERVDLTSLEFLKNKIKKIAS